MAVANTWLSKIFTIHAVIYAVEKVLGRPKASFALSVPSWMNPVNMQTFEWWYNRLAQVGKLKYTAPGFRVKLNPALIYFFAKPIKKQEARQFRRIKSAFRIRFFLPL